MNLQDVLERIGKASGEEDRVRLGEIVKVLGGRSFGGFLLVAGLITLAPLVGDIPGVPTLVGLMVFLVAAQLLLGRDQFWLPAVLLNRSIGCDKLGKALHSMRRPAVWIDRMLRARLCAFVEGPATYAIAICCLIIAASMPMMEVVPFSANIAGAALLAFGLALIGADGLLALVAFLCTAGVLAVVISILL